MYEPPGWIDAMQFGYHTGRGLGGTVDSRSMSLRGPIRPCHYSKQDGSDRRAGGIGVRQDFGSPENRNDTSVSLASPPSLGSTITSPTHGRRANNKGGRQRPTRGDRRYVFNAPSRTASAVGPSLSQSLTQLQAWCKLRGVAAVSSE